MKVFGRRSCVGEVVDGEAVSRNDNSCNADGDAMAETRTSL